MSEKYRVNDGHIIEAVDRTYVAQEYIESMLGQHALIDAVPEFRDKAEQATTILGELYQLIAQYDSVKEISSQNEIGNQFCV